MQRLLERLSQVQMPAEAVDVALLRRFSAVVVEESSSVMWPSQLAEVWRGCGGSEGTSEATVKLVVRWDVLCGQLQGPRPVDGRHSDNTSAFNDDELPAGGLYLADLGFFALWRLSGLARRPQGGKRFFVMRLPHGTGLSTRSGHPLDLRGLLAQQQAEARESAVLLGKQARRPVRLIMVGVSDEVAEQRRQRIREAARDPGREPSSRGLVLAGLDDRGNHRAAWAAQPASSLGPAPTPLADRAALPLVERAWTDRPMAHEEPLAHLGGILRQAGGYGHPPMAYPPRLLAGPLA
jgi:hypothetical protein